MRTLISIFAVLLLVLGAAPLLTGCRDAHSSAAAKPVYRCAMHPQVVQDHPGTCPICGMQLNREDPPDAADVAPAASTPRKQRWKSSMNPGEIYDQPGKDTMGMDLIPLEDDSGGEPGVINLSPERQQRIGVQTTPAAMIPFVHTVRAAATLAMDETRLARVQVKVAGTVERLYADYVGKTVNRGEPLLTLYAPDLYSAQQDYLAAWQSHKALGGSSLPEVRQGGSALLDAARRRLQLWDISEGQIRRLESGGQATRTLTIHSPVSGVITMKNVSAGMIVGPEMELLQIADLTSLWVLADFSDADAPLLRTGQTVKILFDSLPGESRAGRIDFIQPAINPETRTLSARVILKNADGRLRPEMLARVELTVDSGRRLAVPEDAVVMSGTRSLVFVQSAAGEFRPVAVETGLSGDGVVEIRSGLKAGDVVVSAANFLMDSESRLKAVTETKTEQPR